MIDFRLSEEQMAMQKMARDFAQREIKPIAAQLDQDPEHRFNWDIMKKLAENDFLRLAIPEEYGGLGLDRVTLALIFEELAVGCAGISIAAVGNTVVPFPIMTFGTEEQKRRFLSPLCDRQVPRLCAYALTEPGAGSDITALSTTARLEGDEYVLNGTKCFITNAGVASLYLLFASTDRSQGPKGLSAFLLPGDTPGLSIGKIEDKMGQRAAQNAEVILEEARIPKENLLGKEGDGFKIIMRSLDEARPIYTGAISVGLARAAYEEALRYSKQRVQFGSPIFAQQAVSFKLADMATLIETARLLVWKACWLVDNNLPFTKEASMAKFFCSDVAMKVTNDAVQILGGYGYMKDFPVEKFMRDAKIMQIFEGTNEIQHMIIARCL
jgi:alkylation response protein AidB-like acyl-CoA dehydrogenase